MEDTVGDKCETTGKSGGEISRRQSGRSERQSGRQEGNTAGDNYLGEVTGSRKCRFLDLPDIAFLKLKFLLAFSFALGPTHVLTFLEYYLMQ